MLPAELGGASKYDEDDVAADGGASTLHVFTFGGSGGGAAVLALPSPNDTQPCCVEAAESLLPQRTSALGNGAAAAEAGGEFHAESLSPSRHCARPSDALRRGVPCSDDDEARDGGGSAPASRNGRVARHSL